MGFPFLFALCTAASIVIWFVDVEKGERELQKICRGEEVVPELRRSQASPQINSEERVATGELVVQSSDSNKSVDNVGIEKGHRG